MWKLGASYLMAVLGISLAAAVRQEKAEISLEHESDHGLSSKEKARYRLS